MLNRVFGIVVNSGATTAARSRAESNIFGRNNEVCMT